MGRVSTILFGLTIKKVFLHLSSVHYLAHLPCLSEGHAYLKKWKTIKWQFLISTRPPLQLPGTSFKPHTALLSVPGTNFSSSSMLFFHFPRVIKLACFCSV